MGSRKHVDLVSALVFLALSVYVIIEGFTYYEGIQRRGATPFYLSPGLYPVMIGCALLFCSIILLVRSVMGGDFKETLQNLKSGTIAFLKSPTALRSLIGSLWMGIYIFFLLQGLGYLIGSTIFLIGLMAFLQLDTLKASSTKDIVISLAKYALISSIAAGATYVLFQILFRVPLP